MFEHPLEERCYQFAKRVRSFCRGLRKDVINIEDIKQLARSSASIGANYIEANEALSKKDFVMRIKISRKEAKESMFWLKLISTENDSTFEKERLRLLQEAKELTNIFGSIYRKSEN